MKLLFDANLSPKLAERLTELFPGSVHVFETGLARFTADIVIWEYAAAHDFTIVTADSDFTDIAKSRGTPPKVVHLANCNYSTTRAEELLRRNAILIAELPTTARAVLVIRNQS